MKLTFQPGINFARVYWAQTTKGILCLERVQARVLARVDISQLPSDVRRSLVENGVRAVLKMCLAEGFFHADPHPGNLIVEEDGTVVFIDLGMVGRLTPERRYAFMEMLGGLVRKDSRMVVQAIVDLDSMTGPVNVRRLQAEIDLLRDRYLEVPFEEVRLGALFSEIFALCFSYRIRLPAEFTMLSKTLATLEGVVERIAPEVSLYALAEPIVTERMRDLSSFERVAGEVRRTAQEYGHLLSGLPSFLANFLRKVEDENYTVKLRHENFEVYMGRINHAVSRISIGIGLLSACILTAGSAVALGTGLPEGSGLAPVLEAVVEIGLGVIAALLVWLLVAILAGRK